MRPRRQPRPPPLKEARWRRRRKSPRIRARTRCVLFAFASCASTFASVSPAIVWLVPPRSWSSSPAKRQSSLKVRLSFICISQPPPFFPLPQQFFLALFKSLIRYFSKATRKLQDYLTMQQLMKHFRFSFNLLFKSNIFSYIYININIAIFSGTLLQYASVLDKSDSKIAR